jgi:hypothetical protein
MAILMPFGQEPLTVQIRGVNSRTLQLQREEKELAFGAGGAERAFSGATGRTQEENIRWKDSKGGTLVYTYTKPGGQNGNPG